MFSGARSLGGPDMAELIPENTVCLHLPEIVEQHKPRSTVLSIQIIQTAFQFSKTNNTSFTFDDLPYGPWPWIFLLVFLILD